MVIPVAGFVAGANGSKFRTDIAITNSGTDAQVTLTYHPANVLKTIALRANETRVVAGVAQDLFGATGSSIGWILINPGAGARITATSRTYTATDVDPATYGTGVETIPLNAALRSGQTTTFAGVDDANVATVNAGTPGTYRSNLAIAEVSGAAATVKVSLFIAETAAPLATTMVTLGPHDLARLNRVTSAIIGESRDTRFGDLRNVRIVVDVRLPRAMAAFASVRRRW